MWKLNIKTYEKNSILTCINFSYSLFNFTVITRIVAAQEEWKSIACVLKYEAELPVQILVTSVTRVANREWNKIQSIS